MADVSLDNLVIDDTQRGIFRVNRRSFVDPDILELERKRVFDASWLYVGHESEVPEAGDFLTRRVGGRPIIFTRDDDGAIHAFLNTCPHRGNLVCREGTGNTKTFQCFYHAWTFSTCGELVGLPGEDGYSEFFNRRAMGLMPVPRLESYRGLVFLSFDPHIVPLVEFLGGACEYLDYMIDYSAADVEIVGGTQAYSMRANWKLLIENSIDAYHGMPTHQRFFGQFLRDMEVPQARSSNVFGGYGVGRALGNGHSVIETPAPPIFISARRAEDELAAINERVKVRFGEERAHRILNFSRNLFIFPNLIFIANWRTVRTFYPITPDYMEINAWGLMPKDDSPELRQMRLDNFISFLGPAGFGTPDDVEALEGCQRGFAAVREMAWSDISRGMAREQAQSTDELQMRAFWRRWYSMMTESRVREEAAAAQR